MRLRAAGEKKTAWPMGDGGAMTSGCGGRAVRTAGERTTVWPAGDGGAMTACGTEGGEPVRTESVSVRSGSFGGGAR